MVSSYERELKNKLREGVPAVLQQIRATLHDQSDKWNTLIQLEARQQDWLQRSKQGIMSQEYNELSLNKIRHDLLHYIDERTTEDFRGPERPEASGSTMQSAPNQQTWSAVVQDRSRVGTYLALHCQLGRTVIIEYKEVGIYGNVYVAQQLRGSKLVIGYSLLSGFSLG